MKRFPLLPLVALVALFVAGACTDATSPPNAPAIRSPNNPSLVTGNAPPPPVDASIVICGGGGCVVVDGSYNATGGFEAFAALAAEEEADFAANAGVEGRCSQPGKAWLKFDRMRKHHGHGAHHGDDVRLKGKPKIRCKDEVATGKGTIEYEMFGQKVVVKLREIIFFDNTQECGPSTTPCASFMDAATAGRSTPTPPRPSARRPGTPC